MQTIIVPNYGKTTHWKVAGRILYKYMCKWIKLEGRYKYQSGKAIIVAPDMDTAIEKAYNLKGKKPCLVQKV